MGIKVTNSGLNLCMMKNKMTNRNGQYELIILSKAHRFAQKEKNTKLKKHKLLFSRQCQIDQL